jgi:hypothetical protein
MSRNTLTVARAKDLAFQDLVEESFALLGPFEKPEGPESKEQQLERLSRTLDEIPDIYGWLLTLHSYFSHWTDAWGDQYGTRSSEFKMMRQKRDAMENAAKAAKLRYEGASRLLTLEMGFDSTGMPTSRSR